MTVFSTSIAAECVKYESQLVYGQFCGVLGHIGLDPQGINDAAQVAGMTSNCNSDVRAFSWTNGSPAMVLPIGTNSTEVGAYDLNSHGQIVGYMARATQYRGFLYENGTVTDLGSLPDANWVWAEAINEASQVVGHTNNVITGPLRAFLWDRGEMSEILVPLGPNAVAQDINSLGQVVGWMGSIPFPPHVGRAFLWDDGAVIDLGLPTGALNSDARAINDNSVVCGVYVIADPNGPGFLRRGFKWENGRFTDLGMLPGYSSCFALDINDAGEIVGYCKSSIGALTGFIYRNGMMYELINAVPAGILEKILIGSAINNKGQIAAPAVDLTGENLMIILTPIPPNPGDVDCDWQVNINDLLAVISSWHFTEGPGDLNGDGIVNLLDLMIVIENWQE